MRFSLAMLSLPLLALAACGGGGSANSLGSVAPPTGGTGSGTGGTVTPTPTPTPTSFLDVSAATQYSAVGALQSLVISDNNGQISSLYQGNASTVATPSGSITYSPRDGIFTMTLADTSAGVSRNVRFQDPGHRTDFSGLSNPPLEVPNYTGFNYLEAADGATTTTFFYQRPGGTTSYVSLGGFVHSEKSDTTAAYSTEHGVFAFGSRTSGLQVPVKGTGHFDGDFIATMVSNQNVFQWMKGTSSVDVDFAKSSLALSFNGTVGAAYFQNTSVPDSALYTPSGSTFAATGTATFDSSRAGFSGAMSSASFTTGGTTTAVDFGKVSTGSSTAGASSIDGSFYGPNAVELGGNFRIVGGVPNQRVDILGAFTGAKK